MVTKDEVKDIAELEVRRYFDHFLSEALPEILREHSATCPHGKKLSKFRFIGLGFLIGLAVCFPQILSVLDRIL